jgi:putative ABC transport system permease protein
LVTAPSQDRINGMLRLAVRSLLKTPAFTITVLLTLALAIGANTAVFSAIDAVLLKPLPFPESGRLARLTSIDTRNNTAPPVAPARLLDWQGRNSTFQTVTGYYTQDGSELSGDLPERIKQAYVARHFFETWGVLPALGRDFAPEEWQLGGPQSMIISDRFWRRRFSADPAAIGKQLRFARLTYTIVGVMPASFLFEDREVDVWQPAFLEAPFARGRNLTWFNVMGRMKRGVSIPQAQADMRSLQASLGREFGLPDSELAVAVEPLKETTIRGVRQSLWIVFGAVTLLLLIACTNIAALLLARARQREQDVAVRFSLGASRWSVVRQLLAEALVLSLAGAAIGLAVAFGASTGLRRMAAGLPRIDEMGLDGRILFYSLICAVAVTVLCGLIPAVRGSRNDTRGALAQTGRGQVSARNATQWTLVGVQIALAVTLLTGAGLLLQSFRALGQVPAGFDARRVLTLRISTSWAESPAWMRRTLDSLTAVPGVEGAATAMSLPGVPAEFPVEMTLADGGGTPDTKIVAENRFVSPAYFGVMHIPLLAGDMCRDDPDAAFASAVVNRSFAQKYFSGANAVGHNLRPANAPPTARLLRISGVVSDARETGLNRAFPPLVYSCGTPGTPLAIVLVRTRSEPMAMAEALRRKLREIEPGRSLYDVAPLERRLSDAFSEDRLRTVLLTLFAVTAVSLATVGLYGTLSYFVVLRRRELGLRLALGAGRDRIVRQIVGRGLATALAGCAVGLGLALAFARVLAGMLLGVSAWDPATLAAVLILILCVAALASLAPATRAAGMEPMKVLRED